MRLYDKVLSQSAKLYQDEFRGLAPQTTVLTADAIAAHYADSDEMIWGADKYPHARAPWDCCFVEWNCPTTTRMHGKTIEQPKAQGGAFCTSRPFTGITRSSILRELRDPRQVNGMTKETLRQLDRAAVDGAVHVVARPASYVEGRLFVPPHRGIWVLSETGEVLFWFMQAEKGAERTLQMLMEFADMGGTSYGLEWFHITWLAFTFANTRRVKLVDVTQEMEPEPRVKRRLKLPDVRRVTLEINGVVDQPRREFDGTDSFRMPFHLCRGHFATYTAERPLFGNSKLVGRFWIAPHTKGDRKFGEVHKDYALSPPADATENLGKTVASRADELTIEDADIRAGLPETVDHCG